MLSPRRANQFMKLYHGSNVQIRQIDLTRSRRGKDFGQGFYLNANYDQALAMAKRTYHLVGQGSPIVSAFEFDIDAAKSSGLNIKIFDEYSVEWAEFVVMNRKNVSTSPSHPYDIVIGPIADDTVGVQIRRYIQGYIPVERLVEELRYLGDYAVQYFFGTEKAISFLNPIR